ncbi:ferredoxin [Streptomyces canus]|uniref:ferredoxin n=1 Tax=Streptomyces canus TaxID=58343 RepID=UPI003679A45A
MGESWKVTVDPRVCVRTGLCVASAPKEFGFDEQGQGRAISETVSASEEVLEVAESCPIEAISLADAESGEPVFPPES